MTMILMMGRIRAMGMGLGWGQFYGNGYGLTY
jgi:hypothetical protein